MVTVALCNTRRAMTKAQEILKQIVESIPPKLKSYATEISKDEKIRIGQYYSIDGEPYLLVQASYKNCTLVALSGGNRWNEGIEVEQPLDITPDEFAKIAPVDRYPVTKLDIILPD
jgi:hypothetical protein